MKILKKLFKNNISVKMKDLYEEIHKMANNINERTESEISGKMSVKEYSKWYSGKIKEYENIIDEAELKVGLKNVCGKGCYSCCKQAIYINPAEYNIIAKYVEQLGYSKKEQLKKQVVEAIETLKKVDIPMKTVDGSQAEQDRINNLFFQCNIRCPFLSEDNICEVYEIRPCVCWSYRNYHNKSECKESFNPQHSCAFTELDMSMTKEMYVHGKRIIKHQDYYLLIYALGKMLYVF